MLIPALLPLCGASAGAAGAGAAVVPLGVTLQSLGEVTALHTLVTFVTGGAIAFAAYEYLGLSMLRRGWINFDWLWCAALTLTGILLIVSG